MPFTFISAEIMKPAGSPEIIPVALPAIVSNNVFSQLGVVLLAVGYVSFVFHVWLVCHSWKLKKITTLR